MLLIALIMLMTILLILSVAVVKDVETEGKTSPQMNVHDTKIDGHEVVDIIVMQVCLHLSTWRLPKIQFLMKVKLTL